MTHYMYVAVQEDDKVSTFTVDPDTGSLTHQADLDVSGGPFTMAVSPDRTHLYVGCREDPQLISFDIDQANGALSRTGMVALEFNPTYINTDRKGGYVLSSYYQGAHVGVHPIGDDGSVGGSPVVWLETATGAHSMQTDPTNTYAFVPHIAGNGPNQIYQFRFDENTGQIEPNSPGPSGAGRIPRAPAFLLPSVPGRPVLLQRAGLQRWGLPAGCRQRHVDPVPDRTDHTRRFYRAEHLFSDPGDRFGTLPLRSQPGP